MQHLAKLDDNKMMPSKEAASINSSKKKRIRMYQFQLQTLMIIISTFEYDIGP